MRCSARALLAMLALLGAAGLAHRAPAAPALAATDAFHVNAPPRPWLRAVDLDPPGRLTWALTDPHLTTALLRAEVIGIRATTPAAAVAEVLGRERADVLDRAEHARNVDRGAFEADSALGGKLAWRGFHVHVGAGERSGEVWRWVALDPAFPQRPRAFLVALDEQTLASARGIPHEADARALLASLEPTGRGLAGGLLEAYVEARILTFAARVDSTTRLCWLPLDDEPGHASVGVARGLAGVGDFFQLSTSVPRDSTVDAASTQYGVGFDRNGDGKIDLAVLNRGLSSARGGNMIPVVVVLADDDFDGHVDGCVLETGDADGDGRADHRICVLDTNHDGKADRAVRFTDFLNDRSNRKLSVKDGVVEDRVVGSKIERLEFTQSWREGEELLARWNRVRAACTR